MPSVKTNRRHHSNEIHTSNYGRYKDKPNSKKTTFTSCEIWWCSNPDICKNIRRRIQELAQRHRRLAKQPDTTTSQVYCRSQH